MESHWISGRVMSDRAKARGSGLLPKSMIKRRRICPDSTIPEKEAQPELAVVCTENLNPNVLTMKSAQYGARIYDAGSLNLARDRCILVQ